MVIGKTRMIAKEDKCTHGPLWWELYLPWMEVNFQPPELQEVSFATDRELSPKQGLYTDRVQEISSKTGSNLDFNWFFQLNLVFNWF